MDLSKFESRRDGIDMPVEFEGTVLIDEQSKDPVTIKLIGQDSSEFTGIRHRLQTKRLNQLASGGKKKIKLDSLELDNDTLEQLVACTLGWIHVVIDGKEVEFSSEQAKELYTRFRFIREQAENFIADRSNFLGNS